MDIVIAIGDILIGNQIQNYYNLSNKKKKKLFTLVLVFIYLFIYLLF